jgi:peptidoglycan/xylan/chitin deacetylase (PgdA/CDA1 family)
VPVLVYHHLRPTAGYAKETWSYKMSVSPDVFARQMQWLADEGFTTVSLDEAVAVLAGASSIEKPVVITFDDNQRSALDVALPIFAKHEQTATFYLITNRLENASMIGSADIPTLLEAGMDVQSHTVSHPALTTLSASALATELRASREALEALTGKPVRHVAYPLTAHNQTVREATQAAGYVTGSIMDPRVAQPGVDLFKLPRIMVTDETSLATILE